MAWNWSHRPTTLPDLSSWFNRSAIYVFESDTRMVAVLISGLPEQRGAEVVWERVGVVVPTLQEEGNDREGQAAPPERSSQ